MQALKMEWNFFSSSAIQQAFFVSKTFGIKFLHFKAWHKIICTFSELIKYEYSNMEFTIKEICNLLQMLCI